MENYKKRHIESISPNVCEILDETIKHNIDLGRGNVTIDYKFYLLEDPIVDMGKYYLKNTASSGIEIRRNSRLITHKSFSDIWDISNHNDYNKLLIVLNVISDKNEMLPKTKTAKTGFRENDKVYMALIDWLKNRVGKLSDYEKYGDKTEGDLVAEWIKKRDEDEMVDYISTAEFRVFKKFSDIKDNRVDIHSSNGESVILIEAKNKKATLKHIYQLLRYIDGYQYDNQFKRKAFTKLKAKLICTEYSKQILEFVTWLNKKHKRENSRCSIELSTWEDNGIDPDRLRS